MTAQNVARMTRVISVCGISELLIRVWFNHPCCHAGHYSTCSCGGGGGGGGEVRGERVSPDVLVSTESNDVEPLELRDHSKEVETQPNDQHLCTEPGQKGAGRETEVFWSESGVCVHM